jgi:hypothetical protein
MSKRFAYTIAITWKMTLRIYRETPFQLLSARRGVPFGSSDQGPVWSYDAMMKLASIVSHPIFVSQRDSTFLTLVLYISAACRTAVPAPWLPPRLTIHQDTCPFVVHLYHRLCTAEGEQTILGRIENMTQTASAPDMVSSPMFSLIRQIAVRSTSISRYQVIQAPVCIELSDLQHVAAALDRLSDGFDLRDVKQAWQVMRGGQISPTGPR